MFFKIIYLSVELSPRYSHFWRRFKGKWKASMGFAAISDQLACDDCLDFKEEFKNACDIRINYS